MILSAPVKPMIRSLERRDPAENAYRYYRLDLGRDLFGIWCVTRRWGRIGTQGQHKIDSFDTRAGAEAFCTRTSALKQRRGYNLKVEHTPRRL